MWMIRHARADQNLVTNHRCDPANRNRASGFGTHCSQIHQLFSLGLGELGRVPGGPLVAQIWQLWIMETKRTPLESDRYASHE